MEYVTGLVPALAFQFVLNSTRLGLYETVDKLNFTRYDGETHHSLSLCVIWGGICGVAGAAVILIKYILIWLLNDNNFCFNSKVGCPLYMVKTQLQSQSHGKFAVGFQHNHSGMVDALNSTYKQHGFRGLYRGFQGATDNYIF